MKKVNDIYESRPANELRTRCDDTRGDFENSDVLLSWRPEWAQRHFHKRQSQRWGRGATRTIFIISAGWKRELRTDEAWPSDSRQPVQGWCSNARRNISARGKKVQKWSKRQMTPSPVAQKFFRKTQLKYEVHNWRKLHWSEQTYLYKHHVTIIIQQIIWLLQVIYRFHSNRGK